MIKSCTPSESNKASLIAQMMNGVTASPLTLGPETMSESGRGFP